MKVSQYDRSLLYHQQLASEQAGVFEASLLRELSEIVSNQSLVFGGDVMDGIVAILILGRRLDEHATSKIRLREPFAERHEDGE
jgi:hypothetical protein